MNESDKRILRGVAQSERGDEANHPDFIFWCPACHCGHGVWTTKHNYSKAIWEFDGNMERPTFKPSLKITGGERGSEYVCHLVVTGGILNFCSDCTHSLAGKSIPMEAF